jgi:hypothetical protein
MTANRRRQWVAGLARAGATTESSIGHAFYLISTSLVTVILVLSLGDIPPVRVLAMQARRSKRSSPWLCKILSMVSTEVPSILGHNLSSLLTRIVVEYRLGFFPDLG